VSGDTQNKGKANIRLAILLGMVAFSFFLVGLYLAAGGNQG